MRDGQKLIYETVYIGNFETRLRARAEDDKQIDDNLPGKLKDARAEVEQAWRLDLGHCGYPSEAATSEKIPATGTQEDTTQWVMDRMKLFHAWTDTTPFKGIAFDICYRGLNYAQCGDERGLDRRTVADRFKQAMNHWAVLRGWGDQLNPPVRAVKSERPDRGDFKVTRIIVFADA